MKRQSFLVGILLLLIVFVFASCNSNDNSSDKNNTNEIYMNEKGSWSNGVEFEILDHRITNEISSSYTTYTTQDIFIVIKLQVFNGSSSAFSADATDAWLTVNGAKIYQQNFVERDVNGFSDINQSPTTTKYYYLIFEVGSNIPMEDLKLVVHNGSLMNSESLVIKLKDAPKDCEVTLNYSYEREDDKYTFYSGTTIVPSNFPTPIREGYKFCGWYQTSDFSDEALSTITLEKNQTFTLYAKWEESKINITYNGNGNTGGATEAQSVQIGTSTTIQENGFTKAGFNFVGWTLEIGSNEIIAPNSTYNVSLNQTDIILYAKWSKEIKTVEDFNEINNNSDAIYFLKNDLDCNNQSVVTVENFQGVFWGNHHKISNSNSALFKGNNGEINGLIVEDCALSRTDEFSFEFYFNQRTKLCGYGGLVAYNSGIISNCYVVTSLNENVENICFGGIVAVDKGGTINNSKVNLILQSEYICDSSFWGGVVGVSLEKTTAISNCIVQCKIRFPHSGQGASTLIIGGIMAGTYSSNVTIQHCFVDLDMDIAMNYTAYRKIYSGIVAVCSASSKINSCAVIGTVNYPKTMYETVDAISQHARSKSNDNVTNCFADNNLQYNMVFGYNVENVETSLFFSKDFYEQKKFLNLYISEENLAENPNDVWVIGEGALPKLYWE